MRCNGLRLCWQLETAHTGFAVDDDFKQSRALLRLGLLISRNKGLYRGWTHVRDVKILCDPAKMGMWVA